jgi:hypothetical protein
MFRRTEFRHRSMAVLYRVSPHFSDCFWSITNDYIDFPIKTDTIISLGASKKRYNSL